MKYPPGPPTIRVLRTRTPESVMRRRSPLSWLPAVLLLVIAADEGVMPQTREHLDICQLLQVKQGILVLTKIDLVEPDWLELVEDDIRGLISDTFLQNAPIVPVGRQKACENQRIQSTRIERSVHPTVPKVTFPRVRLSPCQGRSHMLTTILVAAITALIMCFVVSLIEDFVLLRRSANAHPAAETTSTSSQHGQGAQE